MSRFSVSRLVPLVLPALAVLLTGCHQNQASAPVSPSASAEDPPSRVARLSFVEGSVSFKAAGSDDWVPATVNRPLTAGDELWTTSNSRAELELGHANVWLDTQTSVEFLNLSDRFVQLKVTGGAAQVHLERLDEDDEFEVDTPQAAFTLLRTGEYRFTAAGDGSSTTAIARSGQIEAATSSESFTVRANQQARLTQQDAAVRYEISNAPPQDGFDTFTQGRENRINAETQQNVSPYAVGRGDLSVYGTWRTYPTYGPVWIPRGVPVGWAPYRFGHWVWIAPWGWTWIDDAPWGFAPFHYGRWVIIDGLWVWIPGPPRIRPIYAPALVIFVGGGPGLRWHFGVNMGLGVAWFPLGPREVYIPPYRASRVYITNVNISHTVIANPNGVWRVDPVRQRYMNRTAPGAITAVPEDVFAGARPVERARVNVSPREAANTRIGGSAAPVPPSRESIAARPDGRTAAPPPSGVERRPVTVRRTPAPSAVPLEQQRPALERNPGRPADPGRVDEIRRQQPASRPDIRQSRPSGPSQSGPPQQPRSAPTPPSQPRPQTQPRQDEGRRRGIEQEHQRDSQRSSGARQPSRSTRSRGK